MRYKLLIILLLIPLSVLSSSYDVVVNDLYYRLNKETKEAMVVNGSGYTEEYPGGQVLYYSGDIDVPETVDYEGVTYTVTSIEGGHSVDEMGFMPPNTKGFEDSPITSITLPNSITQIEPYTFRGCGSLKSITFGSAMTSIGEGAFMGCGFESFAIPEGVESIEYQTFYNCKNLKYLTIPKSMKRMDKGWAFMGCESLEAIYISDLEAWCKIQFHIGENPLGIAHSLYLNNEKITNLVIPESITRLSEAVFERCYDIETVTIPNGVVFIGLAAFNDCKNIKTVTYYATELPESYSPFSDLEKNIDLYVPTRSRQLYLSSEKWNCFKSILPIDGMYLITYNVDGEEYKIVEVKENSEISPEASPTKDDREFSGWAGIPDKMPSDDVSVTGGFKYNIKYMVDDTEYKTVGLFYGDAVPPEENPNTKGKTFSGWSEVPETMPAKDMMVNGSFSWSKSTIDNVVYQVIDNENDRAAVEGNESAIGAVEIRSEVEIDGYKYTVTDMYHKVFENNTNITSVTIPESIMKIGNEVFNGCKNIQTIEIRSGLQIGSRAFANIDKLNDVICSSETMPDIDRSSFENSYIDYATLHVPYALLEKYKSTAPWSGFKEIVAIEGIQKTYMLTYIVDGEVYKTVEKKEGEPITPEAEPTKEGYTFGGWSEMPETMPAHDVTVTGSFIQIDYDVDGTIYHIGEDGATIVDGGGAKGDVIIEATVTINGKIYKVTVIGEGAYKGKNNITSLTIPDAIATIAANAFNGCTGLNLLKLGKGVMRIGSKAFAGIGKPIGVRTRGAEDGLVIECQTVAVPDADADCFDGSPIETATLVVDDNLVDLYKTSSPWNKFGTIRGFNEVVGIDAAQFAPKNTMIFSIDGRRLDQPQKGLNVIQTNNGDVKKFMVK